jgi:hypothetical protein
MNDEQQAVWDRLCIPNPNNPFQRHRLENDKIWLTIERRELIIAKMKTTHIKNCISMLERVNQTQTKAYRGLWAELTRRNQ